MPQSPLVKLPGLHYWRAQRLLTRDELARRARLSSQTLHALEHGERARISTAHRLAEALGVSLGDLIQEPPRFGDAVVTPPAW